jgi:hypothetical protein
VSPTVSFAADPTQVLIRATPPVAVPARPAIVKRSYRNLIATLASRPNEWFSVAPAGISGKDLTDKRRLLLQAARVRGLRLQTSLQNDHIYARIIVDSEAERGQ